MYTYNLCTHAHLKLCVYICLPCFFRARCTVFGVAYPAFESFKAIEEFSSLKDPQEG